MVRATKKIALVAGAAATALTSTSAVAVAAMDPVAPAAAASAAARAAQAAQAAASDAARATEVVAQTEADAKACFKAAETLLVSTTPLDDAELKIFEKFQKEDAVRNICRALLKDHVKELEERKSNNKDWQKNGAGSPFLGIIEQQGRGILMDIKNTEKILKALGEGYHLGFHWCCWLWSSVSVLAVITGITTAYFVCGRKDAHAEENAGTEMDDAEAEGATESKAGFAGGANDDAPQEGDTAAAAAGEAGEAAGSKKSASALFIGLGCAALLLVVVYCATSGGSAGGAAGDDSEDEFNDLESDE